MNRLKDTNIWYYEVPDGYTRIRFASWAVENENAADNGNGTAMMDIPADLSEPCFFADASDDVIYKGGNRRGYWAEKGTLRDAEKWKKTGTKVVDVKSAPFTEDPNTKYVTSTLYDYYTDYELNGNNRGNYDKSSPTVSHRNWVPFRQFDQALSDYYEKAGAKYPIYTGHFQPEGGTNFSDIATTLNLFGYDNEQSKFNHFMAINNSQRNDDNTEGSNHTNYAYQGLVADTTSTGKADGAPLLNGTTSETVEPHFNTVEPHFNKEFLLGKNSKMQSLVKCTTTLRSPLPRNRF